MKKTLSTTAAFGIGVVMCGVAMKAMYGSGAIAAPDASPNKQAVLASLKTTPLPLKRSAETSVVADAAAKVEPAVVDVHTVGKAEQVQSPFGDDPFFRQFGLGGRGGLGQTFQSHGAGSGIIISPDGYILTNDHVIKDTEQVTVTVMDGKAYTAKVIGTDPSTDIAVCKIDTKGVKLPVAELGDSDGIRIGDWAIAVGNPLDIGTTVTLGIISAKDRENLNAEGQKLNSVIQTDAAINPGNSGGALANIDGQVIGINEAIASPTGSYVGIGFAIPINAAKKIAAELIEKGKIVRPYLGVAYTGLKGYPEEARQQMGITAKGDNGVIISQVYPGSPADEAGLQVYDVVLEANRQKIVDKDDLNNIIKTLKVGDTLALLVSRNGTNQIVTVKLKERPADFGQQLRQQRGGGQQRQFQIPQQEPQQEQPDQQQPQDQQP